MTSSDNKKDQRRKRDRRKVDAPPPSASAADEPQPNRAAIGRGDAETGGGKLATATGSRDLAVHDLMLTQLASVFFNKQAVGDSLEGAVGLAIDLGPARRFRGDAGRANGPACRMPRCTFIAANDGIQRALTMPVATFMSTKRDCVSREALHGAGRRACTLSRQATDRAEGHRPTRKRIQRRPGGRRQRRACVSTASGGNTTRGWGWGMTRDSREYPMHRATKCGAKTRRGTRCIMAAMPNSRCTVACRSWARASPRFPAWMVRAQPCSSARAAALSASLRRHSAAQETVVAAAILHAQDREFSARRARSLSHRHPTSKRRWARNVPVHKRL